MEPRERVLAALVGREPDKVPKALSFYRVDLATIAPPGFADITENNIVKFASFADRISLGYLTHSVKNKDFSLEIS